jgi:hypothetical protein
MKTPLYAYTALAFRLNDVIDARPDTALSYRETFDAAADGRLIALLAERYSHLTNWTWVTQGCAPHLEQMEAALCDAASAYEGRIARPTGPISGLCLVMTIVLQAIQQQSRTMTPPPGAEEPDTFPSADY